MSKPKLGMTLEQAEAFAKRTDYAIDPVTLRYKSTINWADAGAFYHEGWKQGMRDALSMMASYQPKADVKQSATVTPTTKVEL